MTAYAITDVVSVSNFPAVQEITGSVSLTGSGITGSVGIDNFPVIQEITGSVSIVEIIDITGSIGITNFPTTQLITGSVSISEIVEITGSIDITGITDVTGSVGITNVVVITGQTSGNISSLPAKLATSTVVSISASVSSVTLLANNTDRAAAIVYNDSPSAVYVKFGSNASYTNGFSYCLPASVTLEFSQPIYTGIVTAFWLQATGSAWITEVTL